MSVVTALSLALFVGFVATGLIGFLGWRQRMREGAVFSPINGTIFQDQDAHMVAKREQYGLEGAPS